MSADFAEGLRLAGAGMGLVFATLVALMVILFALGRLFPGEEAEEAAEAPDTQTEVSDEAAAPVAEQPAISDAPPQVEAPPPPAPEPAPALPPVTITAPRDGVTGAKVAALAVSVYLAMEQEESGQAVDGPAPAPVAASQAGPQPSQPTSNWGNLGRAALWRSQGRRPSAYGQKTHSAYHPSRGRTT